MSRETVILLIEDDDVDIAIFKRAHKKLGIEYPLVVEKDAEKAIKLLKEQYELKKFLVVLDIKMPRINGFDVLQRLQSEAGNRAYCVFVMSSSDNEIDITRAYHFGASGYFIKQHDFDQTLKSLRLMNDFMHLASLPTASLQSLAG